jgi:hypothetical protein
MAEETIVFRRKKPVPVPLYYKSHMGCSGTETIPPHCGMIATIHLSYGTATAET